MTEEAAFNSDDPAYQHERAARRAVRLAVYQRPLTPAGQAWTFNGTRHAPVGMAAALAYQGA